ncbi:MAG: M48 family metallopeptidase [bacterium]
MKRIQAYPVLSVWMALALFACAVTPLTHRQQLALIPESQLVQLSMTSYKETLGKAKISQDSKEVEPVVRVGKRLAAATEQYLKTQGYSTENYSWEFNVIKDDNTVNAWCMPGGKIAVYTGILPITRDDTGLAVVMGHEIAHAVANHGSERLSQSLLVELGGAALSVALQQQPAKTQELFMQAYGAGSQVGVLLPYDRLHESEADRIGLTLMALAGYDPRESVPFWQRMNQVGGQRPPEFLSTHPAPESRIANIQQYIPEAMAYYKP